MPLFGHYLRLDLGMSSSRGHSRLLDDLFIDLVFHSEVFAQLVYKKEAIKT